MLDTTCFYLCSMSNAGNIGHRLHPHEISINPYVCNLRVPVDVNMGGTRDGFSMLWVDKTMNPSPFFFESNLLHFGDMVHKWGMNGPVCLPPF